MANLYEYFKLANPIKDWDGLPFPYSKTHRNIGISQWWGTNGQWYRDNGIDILGHNGIDIGYPFRTEVVFPIKLWVTFVQNIDEPGYGKYLFGQTEEQFIDGQGYHLELCFGHFDDIVATPNRWHEAGELIGYGDSTGFSTGNHLHMGIRPYKRINQSSHQQLELNNGYYGYVDPEPYLPKLRWTIGELENLDMTNAKLTKDKASSMVGFFLPAKDEASLVSMAENLGYDLPVKDGKPDWENINFDRFLDIK